MTSQVESFPFGFDARVDLVNGQVVVIVLGEIDIATGPLLQEALDAAIPAADTRLVIDLSGSTFMDATGIALFARTEKRLRDAHAELILRFPTRAVRRVLRLTGAEQLATIEDRDGGPFLADGVTTGAPPPSAA